MVNPGAFVGSRLEFLMGEKPAYALSVCNGYAADAVAKIQRRYLKRYPIDFPHDKEPTEEFMKLVNDDAPDVKTTEPDQESMSEAEYQVAIKKLKDRKRQLEFRKAQIKCWLAYQYMKDNDVKPKEDGTYNPYPTLIRKLTGKDCVRPRLKTAANVWRRDQRNRIERELKTRILNQQRSGKAIPTTQYAALCDKIARNLFEALDKDDKRVWWVQARDEHQQALIEYNGQNMSDPSTDPKDRQRAIQGLTKFMQPILDMASLVTGWKVSLIAGGPEPALGGRLSTLSIHSGYTSGDIKMAFGRAKRACYKKHIIPAFGSFLQQCYTPEECRSRALLEEDGLTGLTLLPMSSYEVETDEVAFDVIGMPPPTSIIPQAAINQRPAQPVPMRPTLLSTISVALNQAAHLPSPRNQHRTQDSLPVDANPFPFEDDASNVFSPLVSPTLSPPLSRAHSPAPSRQVNNPTRISDSALEGHPAASACPPPVNPESRTTVTQTTGEKRKRGLLEEPVVLEEGSKCLRTKTIRAAVAEEQNLVGRKKRGGKEVVAVSTIGRGKENRPPTDGKAKGRSKGALAKTNTSSRRRGKD